MSDVTAFPPSDAASSAPWPFPRRFLAVFTKPRALFEHLAERPAWFLPFLLLVAATAAYVLATWNAAWLPMILEKMEEQGAGEQAYDFMQNAGLVMYSVFIPVVGAVITFIYAAAVMFVGGFLLGGRLSYRQSLSIVVHAGLVSLLALPIRIGLALAAQNPQVTLGPGALVPAAEQEGFAMKFVAAFLQSFDVFTIWQTVLVAIGVSVIARVGLKPAMIAMFGLFVVFALLGGVFGALGG